jgi:two-component system phosphate regulon sensor histidine kinase PhoR
MLDPLLIIALISLAGFVIWQQWQRHQALRIQQMRNREVRKEALRERDQLLDALGDAFLLVSETSQIVFANACARKLVKGRRLIGRSIMEAFLDDQLSVAIMKCIRTGKPMQERVTLHSTYTPLGSAGDQGVSAWVIDAAPLVSYGSADLTRVVIRDVTTEYQADQVRRDFVANASHELRTPMSIINGYLENLLDDDVLEDPVTSRKFLGAMRKHGQRISRLVEDMLVISKMESGGAVVLNQEAFAINECVQDVCDRLESMLTKQQAEVIIDISPDDLELTGDRFYWTQIIFNLVENALKQNPTPGLRVVIKASQDDGEVTLSVCDNGVGIPAADLPYIFKRFYRVEKHHSQSEIKGTGLGLSIVRRAIDAHGGKIDAVSVPGQRTCFTMVVPDGGR